MEKESDEMAAIENAQSGTISELKMGRDKRELQVLKFGHFTYFFMWEDKITNESAELAIYKDSSSNFIHSDATFYRNLFIEPQKIDFLKF